MNRAKVLMALLFLALTLAGLFTCADYGVPVDEPWEMTILQENMHEYALYLGDDAAAQWYASRGIQPISQSTEIDHGQNAYYPFVPVVAKLVQAPHLLSFAWHVYTWLWFMAGVWALYAFGRETGLGRLPSTLGALLLYLSPRFFAEGHYNNKDMVLLSLVLITLYLGTRFLKKPTLWRGVLFSLAGAMAANTKIAGAFAWAMIGLCALVLVTANRQWNWRMAGVALGTILCFAAFFALITPACWADLGGYLAYLLQNASGFTRWTGVVIFRDWVFDQAKEPLPRYYLPYQMLTTLPLYVPVLAAAGQMAALFRLCKKKALCDPVTLALVAASLCWLVPLGVAMLMRPTVYNGWRHFYFVLAGIAALGAHGADAVLHLGRRRRTQAFAAAALLLCFGLSAGNIVAGHPYQYVYYNALMGGKAGDVAELDYWEVSTRNVLQTLLAGPRDERLPLCIGAREDMGWLALDHAYPSLKPEDRERLHIAAQDEPNPPYVLSNATYDRIYGLQPPQDYHPLVQLQAYGQTFLTLYEKNP